MATKSTQASARSVAGLRKEVKAAEALLAQRKSVVRQAKKDAKEAKKELKKVRRELKKLAAASSRAKVQSRPAAARVGKAKPRPATAKRVKVAGTPETVRRKRPGKKTAVIVATALPSAPAPITSSDESPADGQERSDAAKAA